MFFHPHPIPVLRLRANATQFALLVVANALVGGMVGQQQAVLPLLAETEFGLTGYTLVFTYIAAFGSTKAAANRFDGAFSDLYGHKLILLIGWLIALPVPVMLILAAAWWWVIAANVLLGINQGLAWSTTVVMKVDLAGPARRGLAIRFNEAAGYAAAVVTSLMAGHLAETYDLRPAPFLLGLALGISIFWVSEAHDRATFESIGSHHAPEIGAPSRTNRGIFPDTSFREPALSAVGPRRGWSTTSTAACPGDCFPCCSPPQS